MNLSYSTDQLAIQPDLEPANISSETFLATDYLNHYNEIVMLLEMIPDMPDLIEDAADWKPKGYQQHFIDSGFQAKDLAVQAYELAPAEFKKPFETICSDLDKLISGTLNGLIAVGIAERGVSNAARELIRSRVTHVQGLLLKLNQVIHGKLEDPISTVIESDQIESSDDVQSQADIDKLFD